MAKAIVTIEDAQKELKNPLHELFCQQFVGPDDFFGNGIEVYLEVYDIDTTKPNYRHIASAGASQLLKQPTILQRINYLLESKLGFNAEYVDKQLAFLITQSADMKTKLAAIREFNALKGRIRQKLDIQVTTKSIPELDAEYEALQREIEMAEQIINERQEASDIPVGMPLLTTEQKTAVVSGEAAFMQGIKDAVITQ